MIIVSDGITWDPPKKTVSWKIMNLLFVGPVNTGTCVLNMGSFPWPKGKIENRFVAKNSGSGTL